MEWTGFFLSFLGCAQLQGVAALRVGVASQQAAACTRAATSVFLQQAHCLLTALLTGLFLRHFVMCDVSVQITALHCMQRGLGDRKAVCSSVCLSVKRVNCDKTNERSADILIPYERSIHLIFRLENVGPN